MDWAEILQQIFELCIVPLLGILTTYLVKFINQKTAEIKDKTASDKLDKYLTMLNDTVVSCVEATTQTYVEALKEKDIFDEDAQNQAFQMTYKSILNVLSEDAQSYLTEIYGDLSALITEKIESTVKNSK